MTPTVRDADRAAVEDFRETLQGNLIQPDEDTYNETRSVWNRVIDRHPALITQCSGTADVIAAVNFALEHDLEIAVRGGHNVAGTAVCDDGIVIDLSAMRAVWVDPFTRTARVQGGALWGDVDHEAQVHGLATTGGIVSHTGVAGLILGGGIGWLMCKHGLTIDNLLSADVVTADGELIRASETEQIAANAYSSKYRRTLPILGNSVARPQKVARPVRFPVAVSDQIGTESDPGNVVHLQ